MIEQMLAPWRSSLSLTAATLETMLEAQKNMLGTTNLMGLPAMDENQMREVFHTAANAHLRRWEEIAENLSNVPDVYHHMARVPGSMLTDFFDKAQRSFR